MPVQHEDPKVRAVGERLSNMLADAQDLFKPGAKLTLLVRHPSSPAGDQDIVITNDKLADAIAALEIRRANGG